MMRQNIKTVRFTSLLIGVFSLAIPFSAMAYNPIILNPALINGILKKKNVEGFCTNFSTASDELVKNFSDRRQKVDAFLSGEGEMLGDSRNQRDAKLEEMRSEGDQQRSEWYGQLEGKAQTDTEREAVDKFKKTVEAAVDDRRMAVDNAIALFREGVNTLLETRKTAMASLPDAFRKAVDAALDQVKTDCDNGLTTAQIRTNFRNNLKAARTKIATDKTNREKIKDQIHALAETRRASVKKAVDAFQATLAQATTDLKKAFGETTP